MLWTPLQSFLAVGAIDKGLVDCPVTIEFFTLLNARKNRVATQTRKGNLTIYFFGCIESMSFDIFHYGAILSSRRLSLPFGAFLPIQRFRLLEQATYTHDCGMTPAIFTTNITV